MKSATPVIAQQTAIVIGASMAGLLAAAALAPLYRRVLVLERDDLRDRSSPRKGVPQAAHVHGFLAAGCAALEQLLPGIVEQVEAAGGAVGDMLQDARFYVGREQRFVAGVSGIQGLVASRLLLEQVVAQAVGALPNVEIRSGVQVSGPSFDPAAQRVTGVICQPHGASDDAQQALPAALVVDASDLGLPCVPGKRPFGFGLVQRYSDRLMRAASRDMGAARAVLRVVHMLDRPGALLAPATVYRALRYGAA